MLVAAPVDIRSDQRFRSSLKTAVFLEIAQFRMIVDIWNDRRRRTTFRRTVSRFDSTETILSSKLITEVGSPNCRFVRKQSCEGLEERLERPGARRLKVTLSG